jgi:hypothetical protein
LAVLELNESRVLDSLDELVRVKETHLGKAVFAGRCFPEGSIIGEITGRVFDDTGESDDYTFEYEDRLLDPVAPFRYLNHDCEANCEFDMVEIPAAEGSPAKRGLFLMAAADIQAGQELTIDYNWPAAYAIECLCRSEKCRGWVVSEEELALIS